MAIDNTRAAVDKGEVIRKNGKLQVVRSGVGGKADDVLMATSPDFAVLGNSYDPAWAMQYKDIGRVLERKYNHKEYFGGDAISDTTKARNDQNMNSAFEQLMQRQDFINKLTGKDQQYKDPSDTQFTQSAYGGFVPRYSYGGRYVVPNYASGGSMLSGDAWKNISRVTGKNIFTSGMRALNSIPWINKHKGKLFGGIGGAAALYALYKASKASKDYTDRMHARMTETGSYDSLSEAEIKDAMAKGLHYPVKGGYSRGSEVKALEGQAAPALDVASHWMDANITPQDRAMANEATGLNNPSQYTNIRQANLYDLLTSNSQKREPIIGVDGRQRYASGIGVLGNPEDTAILHGRIRNEGPYGSALDRHLFLSRKGVGLRKMTQEKAPYKEGTDAAFMKQAGRLEQSLNSLSSQQAASRSIMNQSALDRINEPFTSPAGTMKPLTPRQISQRNEYLRQNYLPKYYRDNLLAEAIMKHPDNANLSYDDAGALQLSDMIAAAKRSNTIEPKYVKGMQEFLGSASDPMAYLKGTPIARTIEESDRLRAAPDPWGRTPEQILRAPQQVQDYRDEMDRLGRVPDQRVIYAIEHGIGVSPSDLYPSTSPSGFAKHELQPPYEPSIGERVGGAFSSLGNTISNAASSAVSAMPQPVKNVAGYVGSGISKGASAVRRKLADAWSWYREPDPIVSPMGQLNTYMQNNPDYAEIASQQAYGGSVPRYSVGGDVMGILDKIKRTGGNVADYLSEKGGQAMDFIEDPEKRQMMIEEAKKYGMKAKDYIQGKVDEWMDVPVRDDQGRMVDRSGRFLDNDLHKVDSHGRLLSKDDRLVSKEGYEMEEVLGKDGKPTGELKKKLDINGNPIKITVDHNVDWNSLSSGVKNLLSLLIDNYNEPQRGVGHHVQSLDNPYREALMHSFAQNAPSEDGIRGSIDRNHAAMMMASSRESDPHIRASMRAQALMDRNSALLEARKSLGAERSQYNRDFAQSMSAIGDQDANRRLQAQALNAEEDRRLDSEYKANKAAYEMYKRDRYMQAAEGVEQVAASGGIEKLLELSKNKYRKLRSPGNAANSYIGIEKKAKTNKK